MEEANFLVKEFTCTGTCSSVLETHSVVNPLSSNISRRVLLTVKFVGAQAGKI